MKITPATPKAVPSTQSAPTTKPTGAAALATATYRPASGAAPTDIEGASRGYTSPTKVESPFSPDEKAALSGKIP